VTDYDVIVVGGGPAGLSAALMLGRCCRRVLVCDRGEPRNGRAAAMHGYLTRDGIAPLEFLARGREELAPYGVEFLCVSVSEASRDGAAFRLDLSNGRIERARFLLLATGVSDVLPDIPGAVECYGRSVFHCPYCDGWEWRGRRLAVLGRKGVQLAVSLRTWSPSVLFCPGVSRVDARARQQLSQSGVELKPGRVTGLRHANGQVTSVELEDADRAPCDAVFFTTTQYAQDTLAARLGCVFTRRGTVNTGTLCNTNVPGVFVAGDASRDAQFVVVAAAEGVKAAMAINQALQRAERHS
jgi:thioredoxin reductase